VEVFPQCEEGGVIELSLPFPVSVNALFFNRKRGGRAKTPQYKAWITAAGWEIKRQRPRPIDGPVSLEYRFEDGHQTDLGNLEKGLTDLLVRHQLIADDGPTVVREIHSSFDCDVVGVRVRVMPIC
jgi:Holliday junction resolvase RusA-like endonuclease